MKLPWNEKERSRHKKTARQNAVRSSGARNVTRTRDLLITNQLLYQLSYIGASALIIIAKVGAFVQPFFEKAANTAVGLSNILDREGGENLSGSSPMKRTHGTGVAPTLVGG